MDNNKPHYEQMKSWINDIFGKDKDIVGCEIGVAQARMETELVEEFPLLFMYGIDPNTPDIKDPRIEFIKEKSDKAAERFKPGQLDFVYIDGDHNYDQVKRDIQNYAKFIKPDGFIAGHDYSIEARGCDGGDGVKFAVNELFNQILFGYDYTWLVYKKDIKW